MQLFSYPKRCNTNQILNEGKEAKRLMIIKVEKGKCPTSLQVMGTVQIRF